MTPFEPGLPPAMSERRPSTGVPNVPVRVARTNLRRSRAEAYEPPAALPRLVRREEVDDDARGSFVVLTPHGRRTIEQAAPGHVASVRRHLIDRLTAEQIRVLGDIGETVLGPLEAGGGAQG